MAKSKIDNLVKIPSAASYLKRVGAEPISLRRAASYQYDGKYRRDEAEIRFSSDGTVTARAGYEPTEQEQSDIRAEWPNYVWPQYVPAMTMLENQPPEWDMAQNDDLFVVRARTLLPGQDTEYSEHPILMVHQLRTNQNGSKDYWCWTFYDDNQWRLQEPPDGLPLYGLEKLAGKTTVFLHEGAKAARGCERLLNAGDHPWGLFLGQSDTAHLGWLGGAHAAYKTDWSELAKAGVGHVIIVADNDEPGKAAIQQISELLSAYDIVVSALQFTDDFPAGFDLGDPFPKSFSVENKRERKAYSGPSYLECLRPATWATAPNPVKQVGRGRSSKPTYRIRRIFIQQWFMVKTVKGPIFVHANDRTQLYAEPGFNTVTRSLAHVPILDAFKARAFARTVDSIAYEPGRPVEIITPEGRRGVNTWVASRIKLRRKVKPAEWEFWTGFLVHLFPLADELHEVKRWLSTLIARPGRRILYALLLYSEAQGVGKTTLCEIVRVMVGEHNSRCPTAHDIVKSQFNGWIVRKRFIYVNEIYESGNLEAYTILKTFITDPNIEANEKMIPQYNVANHAHFIFCSNSTAPLAVEDGDRRIFVPTVTEELKDEEWWKAFHSHLDPAGYEAIAAWAEAFVSDHGEVAAGARAPDSLRKSQLIDDSRSRMDRAVRDLAEAALVYDGGHGVTGAVLVSADIEAWLARKFPKSKLPPQSVMRKWLKNAGMLLVPKRLTVDGQKQHVFAPTPELAAAGGWKELRDYRKLPHHLFDHAI